jgi:putative transposase
MKRKRFTEEQIIAVLKEHEAGAKTADLARKHGISEATFYNWKAKFGGMDVSEAKRLKALEDENAKLKKLLAEQMLDAAALRELLSKMYGPPRPCKGRFADDDAVCINVSGLSRVSRCCGQAMMRSARIVPR